jgi:hypothetical protein
MSLTTDDLGEIRTIIESALTKQSSDVIKPLQDEIRALRNDIKEIYAMLADLQKTSTSENSFQKLSLEKKILKLHTELVYAARQAGITLPSH